MDKLASNRELYDYLQRLLVSLEQRGADHLCHVVRFAIGNAAGLSTEFLGESRIALRRVSQDEGGVLAPPERAELLQVLEQLEDVFERRIQRR